MTGGSSFPSFLSCYHASVQCVVASAAMYVATLYPRAGTPLCTVASAAMNVTTLHPPHNTKNNTGVQDSIDLISSACSIPIRNEVHSLLVPSARAYVQQVKYTLHDEAEIVFKPRIRILPILPPPSPSRPRVPKRTIMFLRSALLAVNGSGKPLLAVAIPLPCWPGICNGVLPLQLQQHDTLS